MTHSRRRDKSDEHLFIGLNIALLVLTAAVNKRCAYLSGAPWRYAAVVLAGFTLASSSFFHVAFGEGRVGDYETGSWLYMTDTYEITVTVTFFSLFALFWWGARGLPDLSRDTKRAAMWAGAAYAVFTVALLVPGVPDTHDARVAYDLAGMAVGLAWWAVAPAAVGNK